MTTSLTDEQKQELAIMVAEQAGIQKDYAKFCDYVLLLFEDIPGFELVVPDNSILRELWAIHHRPPESGSQ